MRLNQLSLSDVMVGFSETDSPQGFNFGDISRVSREPKHIQFWDNCQLSEARAPDLELHAPPATHPCPLAASCFIARTTLIEGSTKGRRNGLGFLEFVCRVATDRRFASERAFRHQSKPPGNKRAGNRYY